MSTINISELPPRARETFMLTEPAITAWDVNAHRILEDSIQSGKRVQGDISWQRAAYEILYGIVVAVIFDIFPSVILYLQWHDHSAAKVKMGCILFMVVTNALIALHRKWKLSILKRQGAEWRENINELIEKTARLSLDERQQLYAVMLALGMQVQQGKQNAAMIQAAYRNGWSDGFIVGS